MKRLLSIFLLISFLIPQTVVFADEVASTDLSIQNIPQETTQEIFLGKGQNDEVVAITKITDSMALGCSFSQASLNELKTTQTTSQDVPCVVWSLDGEQVSIPENDGAGVVQSDYIGQYFDTETNLNYLNARYYEGSRGQFISQDPVFLNPEGSGTAVFNTFLTDPQTQNSYSYARNNPITYSDSDGKFIPVIVGAIYAAAPAIIAGIETAAAALTAGFIAHDVGTIAGTAMSGAPASYKNEVYNGLAENWGAGLSVASQLAPAVAGEARTATRTTLQANKAAGTAFESKTGAALIKTQASVAPQMTLETQSGIRTRIDFMTKNMSGQFCLFECKSSATAPLTKNQSLAFPEIQQSGATIVGKGKDGFPGGMSIPATKVNIVRPNR